MSNNKKSSTPVRYAVVGLGYISQAAVLPAFRHAASNSKLSALVSDDPAKLKDLARRYRVEQTYSYKQYDDCLRSGTIDAVYIALPNSMHLEYANRAAKAGVHVLCEKPMAVTTEECQSMIQTAKANRTKLMIAYRLHFDAANLEAIKIIQSGKIGEPRYFISTFGQQIKSGDIRLQKALGGGSLYDMGVYCINAARYLFRSEPTEVYAASANNGDARFKGIDEMTAATLRFPGERLATFTSSFGAADTSYYRVVGTKGDLVMEPAYDFQLALGLQITVNGKKSKRPFPKSDQFAPELLHFSDCIRTNKEPRPSGSEGLADVRIVRALYESARTNKPVSLRNPEVKRHPTTDQLIRRPAVEKMPTLVHAAPPSRK